MRVTEPYIIFPRTHRSGNVVYYYQFRDEHNRRSTAKSTGCTSLSQARRYVQKLYNSNSLRITSSIKFVDYTKDFFSEESEYSTWKKANGRAVKPETLRSYNKHLKHQLLPFFSDMALNTITISTVKEWVVWVQKKWSKKTSNNAQGVLHIILNSAVEKDLISKNPVDFIPMRKVEKKHRDLLTVQEIKTLYKGHWANERERKAFLLLACTGMRIGEVCALQKEDVMDNCLNVTHTYSSKFGLGSTKTGLNRYVPIPSNFPFEESTTNWVFQGCKDDKPLLPHSVYNAMCRLCEKVGIDKKERGITIHSLRNFFISYMQSKNIPENKIRAVVGHADKTMTDVYTYWKPDMFPEIYEVQRELYKTIVEG